MNDSFDPYDQWLGIPKDQQPPHHYRLLGLPIFETDAERIRAEADRRMQVVRTFQLGQRSQASQKILNELAAARVCLLDPRHKQRYDAALTEWLNARLPVPPPVFTEDAPRLLPGETDDAASARAITQRAAGRGAGWIKVVIAAAVVVGLCGWLVVNNRSRSRPNAVLPESHETQGSQLGGKTVELPKNVVLQSEAGDVNLSLARATVGGPTLKLKGDATTGWSSPDDQIAWEFLIRRPGPFRIEVTYAAATTGGERQARIELSGRQAPLLLPIRNTGGADRFVTDPVTPMTTINPSGRYTLRITADGPFEGELMRLKEVRLVRGHVK